MKDKFPGYYMLSKEEFDSLWKKGLFVFDTNVLLDLYRFTPETVDILFSIMEKVNDRLWIPYQVALEYHKNYCNIIFNQANEYNQAIKHIRNLQGMFENQRSHPFLTKNLSRRTNKLLKELMDELSEKEKEITSLLHKNSNKERLSVMLNDKVGEMLSDEKLAEIYREGEIRYSKKIPPGYLDGKNKPSPDKFGDLVIWMEILEKAKTTNEGIIFVTSDEKEDWFLYQKEITIGPRPELIAEIKKNVNINFYCYNTSSFLKYAQEYLDIKITEDTIKEINESKYVFEDFIPEPPEIDETSLASRNIRKWVNIKVSPKLPYNEMFRVPILKMEEDSSNTGNSESESQDSNSESDSDITS